MSRGSLTSHTAFSVAEFQVQAACIYCTVQIKLLICVCNITSMMLDRDAKSYFKELSRSTPLIQTYSSLLLYPTSRDGVRLGIYSEGSYQRTTSRRPRILTGRRVSGYRAATYYYCPSRITD